MLRIVMGLALAIIISTVNASALEIFVPDLVEPDDRIVATFLNDSDVAIEIWSPGAFTITNLDTGQSRGAADRKSVV